MKSISKITVASMVAITRFSEFTLSFLLSMQLLCTPAQNPHFKKDFSEYAIGLYRTETA